MNDRFADLGELTESSSGTSDVEMGNVAKDEFDDDDDDLARPRTGTAANEELNEFFTEVEEVKKDMGEAKGNISSIRSLYSELLTTTDSEQAKDLRESVGQVRDRTNAIAQKLRLKMKEMRVENKKFAESHKKDLSLVKIRENMHGSLVKKFLNLMQDYQQVLSKFDQKIREKAYRQVQLVSPDADPADIDRMLDDQGDAAEEIFTLKIMEDRKHKNAKQTLDYLKEKQSDLHSLEKSIVELNNLFQDMAGLVETQGDLIDQIEYSVMQSEAYTEAAVDNLQQTEKIVRNTRKKKIWICVIVSVIILILLVVLVVISGVIPPLVTQLK